MWRDHPVFGVGAGNFKWQVGAYQPRAGGGERFGGSEYQERDWSATETHSLYFEVLSEMGILGCLALGMMIVGHFSGLRRLSRRVADASGAQPGATQ